MFSDEHPVQLEFGIHWKTGNPFELICEHLPEQDNSIKIYFDGGKNFRKKTAQLRLSFVGFARGD